MDGRECVEGLLADYGPDRAPSGSSLLDAIGSLPPDRHDVAGAIHRARRALEEIDEDDAFRPALDHIVSCARRDGRYDRHDMTGIVHVCTSALEEAERTSTPSPR